MYNLSLPNLCDTLLVGPLYYGVLARLLSTQMMFFILYCAVPYITPCVDVSGTVLSGPFMYISYKFDPKRKRKVLP